MAKKKKIDTKKLKKELYSSSEEDQARRMLRIILGVVGFLAVVWVSYSLINGDIFNKKEADKEVEIQNEIILAGTTFNRSEQEYYVLFYDFDGDNSRNCATIVTVYKNNKMNNFNNSNNKNNLNASSKDNSKKEKNEQSKKNNDENGEPKSKNEGI